ncbi:STAS domain-containing protein [Peribacillus sp. B-H-3]|jgi:anti-anti-sigma factor|uniref:STAS domain-containing protein n=1 Tax=Peribacillus sp. B-H-3 TaxID=3400420 RepID=UPI003B019362
MFTYRIIPLNEDEVIIWFHGDLDIEITEIMDEEILPTLKPFHNIDINLSEVPFVDSTGIGLLINLIDSLKKDKVQVKIKISAIQPQVKDIFDIIQLSDILGEELFCS